MTGEYCSKLQNIQSVRKSSYEDKKTITVTAFMIMNFNNTTDIIYEWKIKPFIETLKKYLLYDKNEKKLYCFDSRESLIKERTDKNGDKKDQYLEIENIQVIRSDSDPSSNYVICNRICQQMQIADLVIVDVSDDNPNVFYEFGMAISQEKLILPICYSDNFYKSSDLFEQLKHEAAEDGSSLAHHIDCFEWRRKLYEHFGLIYRKSTSQTGYLKYEIATNYKNNFDDEKYAKFPYNPNTDYLGMAEKKAEDACIGEKLYNSLLKGYNRGEDGGEIYNTIVIYTVDKFLNGEEAGKCIVNFYHLITKKVHHGPNRCFVGNRVAVIANKNRLKENNKDDRNNANPELFTA